MINLTRHDFENHLENTSNTIDKILNSIQTFILEKYGSIHQNVHCFIDLYNCQHYLPSSTLLVACLVVLVAMFCALLCCCLCPSSSCCACSLLRKVETLIYKSMNRRCEDLHKPLHWFQTCCGASKCCAGGGARRAASHYHLNNIHSEQVRTSIEVKITIYLCSFRNLFSLLLLAVRHPCNVLQCCSFQSVAQWW